MAILALVGACQPDRPDALTGPGRAAAADASATAGLPTAAVALSTASALLSQTGTTAWTLAKTGAVDATNKMVTWTITATKGTTTAGQLVVSGMLAVTNTGTAGATIGNIAVTLQQKSGGTWTSLSADCADATHGDAATTCHIDPKASSEGLSTISENSASGPLQFLDAHANTLFALTPEQTIAPNAMVTLLFSARFDNNVLKLPVGQAVRAEVIVSFGNSTANKPAAQNVDINGNGTIDADEAWVRSVPARLGLAVPAQQSDNATLTIADVASNITTAGDVTFANPTFNIGTTSGTVTVTYNGGANGGKITNCATGTGSGTTVTVGGFTFPVDGSVGLQACDTQDIGATPTCTAGTLGCGWSSGDVVTYAQNSWVVTPASATLTNSFDNVYNATGIVQVGANFKMTFTDASYILAYLPAVGADGALTDNTVNPTSTSSGAFGGDVLALQLNVDFTDVSVVAGSLPTKFGDLTVCGLVSPSALNGSTVRQVLAIANTLLGGASSGSYTIGDLDDVALNLNAAFDGGTPSTFAQQHLVHGACGWNTGDLTTYSRVGWDVDPSSLLSAQFLSVYPGFVDVGGGFIVEFTSGATILTYLPTAGVAGPLTSSAANPTDTGSGIFGGDVLALQLDIDYADASKLPASTGYKFGDLTLCNMTPSTLNNMSVRQFAMIVNTLLGGGSSSGFSTSDIATLDPIAFDLSAAFAGGAPSDFAQQHIVHGSCP